MFRWILVIVVIAGAYLAAAHFSGGAFYTFGLPLGGERAQLRATALSFMEDLKFKDFERAASYHAPDKQDTVDIPYLLQRLFVQKPEALEVMDYEIIFAEIDSTNIRARVKSRVKAKDLVKGKIRTQEMMLFFHRTSQSAPWYMELESSLRKTEAKSNKKH